MERVHINLTDLQRQRLEKTSQHTGLNRSELIRRAIDDYLDTQEKKRQAEAVRPEDK